MSRESYRKFIETYKNHPSVVTIKGSVLSNSLSFDLPSASQEDINKIVECNANKATRPVGIPFKLINVSGIIDIVLGYEQLELESNLNSMELNFVSLLLYVNFEILPVAARMPFL